MTPDDFRVDRTAFSIVRSHEEAEEEDRRFWLSKSPHERLRAVEYLRRLNYGDRATAGIQRVLEFAARAPR